MSNMSKILEKTISTLPTLLSSSLKGGKEAKEDAGYDFKKFMQKISSFSSREEEVAIIDKEINAEKDKLSNANTSVKEKKESLIKLLYCHMMGYDVSFANIHAVKLAQQGNLLEKRTGYLLCSLFMDETDLLSLLLTNTMQKDLRSTNVLEICTALISACQLVSKEMVPELLPMVKEKLSHNSEVVRKKAVICLQTFSQKAPDVMEPFHGLFEKALCDKDPGVMWASLHAFTDLVQKNPSKHRRLVGVLTDILMQVISRKLPTDYDYHSVPAPWLTIHLLKILALLGLKCESTSIQIYPVVREVLQRVEPTEKMGLAVIYECVETICTIYPQTALLELAAKCVTKFLSAQNINLKFLGLKTLSKIVKLEPRFALDHQTVVMECMEHEDNTIKNQTFTLLLQITNPMNVSVISGKLLDCLKQARDRRTETDLTLKILELLKRYQQNAEYADKIGWFLSTTNEIIVQNHSQVPATLVDDVMEALENKGDSVYRHAVNVYWTVLQSQQMPDLLLQISVWVVSKYWKYLESADSTQISHCLLSWLPRNKDVSTHVTIVQGLRKLLPHITQEQALLCLESLQTAVNSNDRQLYQMLKELQVLVNHQNILAKMTDCTNIKMDFSLSFLDDYVSEALEKGADPYKPPMLRASKKKTLDKSGCVSYEEYSSIDSSVMRSGLFNESVRKPSSSLASLSSTDRAGTIGLKLQGVKKVWGKGGFKENVEETDSYIRNDDEKLAEVNSEAPTEKQRERALFQAALFSGIEVTPSGEKSYETNNEDRSASQLVTVEDELTEQEVDDPFLRLAETPRRCRNDGVGGGSIRLNASENSQDTAVKFTEGREPVNLLTSCAQYAHLIQEQQPYNYEMDSLDGSPENESPPMLFKSEGLSSTNIEQFSIHSPPQGGVSTESDDVHSLRGLGLSTEHSQSQNDTVVASENLLHQCKRDNSYDTDGTGV